MFDRSPRLRARFRAPLRCLALVVALVCLPACEPEECSADFDLSGAIDWSWVWRHPTTTCEVWSTGLAGEGPEIEFINDGGGSLHMTLVDGDLALGSYPATVAYTQFDSNLTWTNEDTLTICLANILEYERVDWVREDRHRIRGTLVCAGGLAPTDLDVDFDGVDDLDVAELTLSEVPFSIYVPDGASIW